MKNRLVVFCTIAALTMFIMACITTPASTPAASVQAVDTNAALQEFIDEGFQAISINRSMVSSNVLPWENPVGVGTDAHAWFAFDGSTDTIWDPYGDVDPGTSGLWVLVDLGEGNEQAVSLIRFMPRGHLPERMSGAVFQGSVDGQTWVDLYNITSTPPIGWNNIAIDNDTPYRFYRYYAEIAGDVVLIEYWVQG